MTEKYLKLLALCDSPTAETGFARVAKNLLPRWLKVERAWTWAVLDM
jgi:hypothetical protein